MKASEIFTEQERKEVNAFRKIYGGVVTGCKVAGRIYGEYLEWREKRELTRTKTKSSGAVASAASVPGA